jgi:hypothetical protein
MGTVAVVVLDVCVEDACEMMRTDDEEMVEAFPADGAHPSLGEGVRVRRSHRGADDLGADRAPHVVEGPGELGVTVADQVRDATPAVLEAGGEVAGLLGNPLPGGVGRDAAHMHPSGLDLDEEQHD